MRAAIIVRKWAWCCQIRLRNAESSSDRTSRSPRVSPDVRLRRARLVQILNLLRRIVGIVFKRMNSRCAHHPGPRQAQKAASPRATLLRFAAFDIDTGIP